MSVLIKRIDSSSGGGSSKGYPPGNVTNVTIKGGYKKVTIKWTDPDDVVVGDKTLSTWQSTTLVRKKGSIPTSIKDGNIVLETTEKNKYKNTEYTDNNLEIGTYYYRFFVCNTDKIYNNDSGMIYSAAVVEFDPILKNNTWEQISEAAESGVASSIWNIGDEIDITLKGCGGYDDYHGGTGVNDQTLTLQIWDFNHFDKCDGSGKAGIVFGTKNLLDICTYWYNTNSDGDNYPAQSVSSEFPHNTLTGGQCSNIYIGIPSDLKPHIKTVHIYQGRGRYIENEVTSPESGVMLDAKLFYPGHGELFGKDDVYGQYQINCETMQYKFPIFTDDDSRIKKAANGSGDAYGYWTRSPFYNSNSDMLTVERDGSPYYRNSSWQYGVCFCFCV